MITKDMTIAQVIQHKSNSAEILMRNGMMCVGCPSSQMETISEAAVVHGMDVEKLLKELNE